MNEDEFAELAAGHALHALSAEDEARYREAISARPVRAAIAEADAVTVADLAEAVEPVAPPVSVRASLLAQIAATPQLDDDSDADEDDSSVTALAESALAESAAPDASGSSTPRRRPLRILFTLAASLVLLVGLGVGAVALNNQLNRPASVIALEQIEAAGDAQQSSVALAEGGTATAHWSTELGSAVLVTDGLEPLDADQTYQLWFVRGETPVSAGLFASGGAEATALLDGEMEDGDVIAVTVEPSGGSPTGAPTTDPIIAIPTA